MSVSVGKITDQVNAKILEGGQNFIDAARLVGSVEALETRYSVANLAALPPAAFNTGRFIYVEDIEAYRFSDGTQWTNDYDTTRSAAPISTQLWAWGLNQCGRLGDGTITCTCSPVREFFSATDWCQVSAGDCHTVAVKTSGELWAWGRSFCGALGDGTTVQSCSPVREFCSAADWCQAGAGGVFSVAVKTSGELWVWGQNFCGRLGDGTVTARCSPVREICSATNWCQVNAACKGIMAVKTSGELWVWGYNFNCQLGDGTSINRCSPVREFCSAADWCKVSGSRSTTAAIKTSGQIWAWGNNGSGQIGDNTTLNRSSPVREFCSATDWCQVSAGGFHTAAIKTSGELWAWGCNFCGRLGDGTLTNRLSPVREFCSATNWCQVSASNYHSVAIKTSGELWAWGTGTRGAIGDGTTVNKCSPVREISSGTDWCQVSAGCSHSSAIKATFEGFNEP